MTTPSHGSEPPQYGQPAPYPPAPPAGQPYGGPPAPYDPPPYGEVPVNRPTDGLSITAFVLGILGFLVITIPFAFLLGIVGLFRTGKTKKKGRWAAVLAIVLALVWSGVAALLLVFVIAVSDEIQEGIDEATSPVPSVATEATEDAVEDEGAATSNLAEGECLTEFTLGAIDEEDIVQISCDEPHEAQVFARFDLPSGPYPGETEAGDAADEGCTERLSDDLRTQIVDGDLQYAYYQPREGAWEAGDRVVICMLVANDGETLTKTYDTTQ